MQNGENHVSSPDHNVKPKDAKKLFDGANNISLSGTQSPKKIRKWRSVQLSGDSGEERVIQNGTDSNDWLNNRRAARSTSFHDWRDSYKNNSFNNPSPNNNGVPPAQFRNQRESIRDWFTQYSEVQKNLLLKDLLDMSNLPQMHLLSLRLEENLHKECPSNCKDWISWLPECIALNIFSFLDPVSLCHASQSCWSWYELCRDSHLWKSLCSYETYMVSPSLLDNLIRKYTGETGEVIWKTVFAEQYRIRNNWMRGRCLIKMFEGHSGGISCVQFDEKRIVSGSWDTTIKVWNIKTNLAWSAQTLTGHSNTVRCLHLSDNRLVSGSTDCTIKVWDLDSNPGWSSIACKATMIGHSEAVRCLTVIGDKLISGSYDKLLKFWDINTGQCVNTLSGHLDHVLCVQADEDKIISGSADKCIKLWNHEGRCTNTLSGHADAVTCLQFDSIRVISGSLDCTIKFWDISTGDCVRSIDWMASEGHTRVIRCIQADEWRLVSGSDDKTIKVWNLESGRRLVTLRSHTDGVTCLQFSDTKIVSGSYDKKVLLWDFTV